MSTNKTTNYQLHSWLPQDEFHLTEINENFALLDAALKAEAGSREALAAAIGERLRIATGAYVGNQEVTSSSPHRIELGLKPKIILLYSESGFSDTGAYAYGGLITKDWNIYGSVVMDSTGFTVRNIYDLYKTRPNITNKKYCYMVFY